MSVRVGGSILGLRKRKGEYNAIQEKFNANSFSCRGHCSACFLWGVQSCLQPRPTTLHRLIANPFETFEQIPAWSRYQRLDAARDRADFIEGFIGSYPNYFFIVSVGDLPDFFDILDKYDGSEPYVQRLEKYGVNRVESRFWDVYDWFQLKVGKHSPAPHLFTIWLSCIDRL